MSRYYKFILGDHNSINVNADLELLNKIGTKISNDLISKGEYYVQSNVIHQNFQTFLNYLTINESINVDINNMYDFLLLNEEFNNIISSIILKIELKEMREKSILQNAISTDKNNKQFGEKFISENLDYFLQKYNDEMAKIPINSLYNIFKHEKRVLNDHELAYQFINNIFNKNNDNNSICILFESLDSTKISNESFNDLISKRKEHFGFLPPVNYSSFIDNIKKDLELKCDHSLSLFFNQMQKQQQQQQQFLNDIYQFLNQKIGTIQNDIKSLSEKIQIIDTKIDKTSGKIGEQYKQYIDPKIINIQSQIEDIKNKTEETNNCVQQISKKAEETNNCVQQISKKAEETNNCVQQISKKAEETNNCVQQISKKAEETNNCVQQISKKNDSVLHCIQFQSHGIIRQLTKEYGGNIHDKGVINVTASSVYNISSNFQPRCAVDLDDTDSRFTTKDEANSWLTYDFKERKVHPTHYSIRSRPNRYVEWHMHNWVIEGSNNESDWKMLDSRQNISVLDDSSTSHIFTIQENIESNEYFRYLRIRQTGLNKKGDYILSFSSLEYFGSIII